MALRINRGWTQTELAWRAKTSRMSIRLAERGKVIGPDIQFRVARQFGLEPTDIWPVSEQLHAAEERRR